MADHDASSAYKQARSMGRKYLSDHAKNEWQGYLPVLDDRVRDADLVGEISLGLREIPLSKILGTRTTARSNAFAGNFMPLLAENTEFGAKWCKLYASHIEEGIREPIKVFEYINRYFVQEGNKRVSVLRYCGAVSAYARVTRLVPRRDEDNQAVSIYYEFLDFDRREVFDNLWFSRRGVFTTLTQTVRAWLEAQGLESDNKTVAEYLRRDYAAFRHAYKEAGFAELPLTTGDAYGQYVEIFGFTPEQDTQLRAANVRSCETQFRLYSLQTSGETTVNNVEMKSVAEKTPLSFFSKKRQMLKVAFAFEATAETNLWTQTHELALFRLRGQLGDKIEISTCFDVPPGEASYDPIDKLLEGRPDILFATSPNMSTELLRLSLEHPDTAILCCDGAKPNRNVMTYFPRLYEGTWLMGILAGSMTATDAVGFITPAWFHQEYTQNLNAFSAGARLVNPRVQVLEYRLSKPQPTGADYDAARQTLALRGADMAYCPHQLHTPLVRKAFPGVLAQLYSLDLRNGHPTDAIGALAVDWSIMYSQMVIDCFTTKSSILDISRTGEDASIHFGWGMNTGIVDVYGVDAFLGHNATRLMSIFRQLLISDEIRPFEGPLFDQAGELRLEKGDTMSLLEIESMTWRHEAVAETLTDEGPDGE